MSVVVKLFHWFQSISHSVIRNRVTEQDIREWLTAHGHDGKAAQLSRVELVAIERPGWRQIYKFDAKLLVHGRWSDVSGIVHIDDRYSKIELELFDQSAITCQSSTRRRFDTRNHDIPRQRGEVQNEDNQG